MLYKLVKPEDATPTGPQVAGMAAHSAVTTAAHFTLTELLARALPLPLRPPAPQNGKVWVHRMSGTVVFNTKLLSVPGPPRAGDGTPGFCSISAGSSAVTSAPVLG